MTQVIDQWTNSFGERVQLMDNWEFVVIAANGQKVPRSGLTPKRCDRAPSAHNGTTRQGKDEPLYLEPVPYWAEKDRK